MSFRKTPAYRTNVFINCPFDTEFDPIFEAIVFTVFVCGFRAVSARQRLNSAEVRLDKILSLIGDSRLSIHDLSRTRPDEGSGNPRFNMPFELGLDIGCRSFVRRYSDKCALIFAAEKYEYQKFLCDIAGQDIEKHMNDPRKAIEGVRAFLAPQSRTPPPGPQKIAERYDDFRRALPRMLARAGIAPGEMQFSDLSWFITEWLEAALT